eukprot:1181535-Prorocentrum_minimum.AAC.3
MEDDLVRFKVGGNDVNTALASLLQRFAAAVAEQKPFEIQDFPGVEVTAEVRVASLGQLLA